MVNCNHPVARGWEAKQIDHGGLLLLSLFLFCSLRVCLFVGWLAGLSVGWLVLFGLVWFGCLFVGWLAVCGCSFVPLSAFLLEF